MSRNLPPHRTPSEEVKQESVGRAVFDRPFAIQSQVVGQAVDDGPYASNVAFTGCRDCFGVSCHLFLGGVRGTI